MATIDHLLVIVEDVETSLFWVGVFIAWRLVVEILKYAQVQNPIASLDSHMTLSCSLSTVKPTLMVTAFVHDERTY